jgi:dolichol kinase
LFSSVVSTYFLIICCIIALTELITPMKYDNVTIPVISSILFTIFKIF